MRLTLPSVEIANPALTQLSRDEQEKFVARVNADSAFTEVARAAECYWNRIEWRALLVLIVTGVAGAWLIPAKWLWAVPAVATAAVWYLAERYMWGRWLKRRWVHVTNEVIARELKALPVTTNEPRSSEGKM
jgi:hypothetical protein